MSAKKAKAVVYARARMVQFSLCFFLQQLQVAEGAFVFSGEENKHEASRVRRTTD